MSSASSPSLTLVHIASHAFGKGEQVRQKARHLSVFRHWIEQMTLSMAALEAELTCCHDLKVHYRFRQLRHRFIRVQNEAYLCCVTMESRSNLRRERAAYRIPRLMWMMIQIRSAAQKALLAA